MPPNDRGRKNLTIKDSKVTSKEGPNIKDRRNQRWFWLVSKVSKQAAK